MEPLSIETSINSTASNVIASALDHSDCIYCENCGRRKRKHVSSKECKMEDEESLLGADKAEVSVGKKYVVFLLLLLEIRLDNVFYS